MGRCVPQASMYVVRHRFQRNCYTQSLGTDFRIPVYCVDQDRIELSQFEALWGRCPLEVVK